jgi:hypothetical protein
MPRPCGHTPGTTTDCRLCYLAENDTRYQELWGELPVPCEPLDDTSPRPSWCVQLDADGVGDAILALTCVAGLKQAHPRAHVTFHVRGHIIPWVNLFADPDLVTDQVRPWERVFYPYSSYGWELSERSARPRWEYYADTCGVTPVLPTPRPLSPAADFPGHILLFPFAQWDNRNWPLTHWHRLEEILLAHGHKVLILDRAGDGARLNGFRSFRMWGQAAERVAGLLQASRLVIGNDSGMVHLAGALGRKAIALCGPSRGDSIFGLYGGVTSLQGLLHCGPCYWRGPLYTPVCYHHCANLDTITPERVLKEVQRVLLD